MTSSKRNYFPQIPSANTITLGVGALIGVLVAGHSAHGKCSEEAQAADHQKRQRKALGARPYEAR